MAIELTGIVPRHERRLRLVFSNTLGVGAFGSPAPSHYVIESQDGKGSSPGVSAAIIVSGAVTTVDLALDTDLVDDALYRITAIGVPAGDASTSTAASDQKFRFNVAPRTANVEPKASDGDLLLYGRDLIFTGHDYLETPEGDLATVGGIANAQLAIRARVLGAPLPWAPGYSPRAREYVDVPITALPTLRGRIEKQVLLDDRVRSVIAKIVTDEGVPEESLFEVTTVFKGGHAPEPIYVDMPV